MAHAEQSVATRPPLRLFFALWPDAATRAALASWSRTIQPLSGGRATRAETLHLTLAFLGATDAARLPALEAAAARIRTRPFVLALDEAGLWSANRIVWAGASSIGPALGELVADLRAALTEAAVHFDPKPFVPHITLIRKARPGFALPRFEPIRWPVHEFVLVRSTLGPTGSDYSVQACWG